MRSKRFLLLWLLWIRHSTKLQRVGNSYWDAATEFGEKMAAGNPDNTDLQEIMDNFVAGITQSVAK